MNRVAQPLAPLPRKMPPQQPVKPQELLSQAQQCYLAGQMSEAQRLCLQILAADVRHAEALHLLGAVEMQAGHLETALKMVHRAIACNGREALYHSTLGYLLHHQGRQDEAIAACRQALKLNPLLADAQNNLGNALYVQGKLEEASACYERALQIDPNFAGAQNNLGNALYALKRIDEAEACYRRALAAKPDYAVACFNLGNVHYSQGRLEEAARCYEQTLKIKPDYAEACYGLGNALYKSNPEQAAVIYERALKIKPDYAEVHNNLGSILKDRGQLDEAEACFKRALAIKPDYAEARFNLANTSYTQGRLEEAIDGHKEAIALDPGYAEAYCNMGIAFYDSYKLDEANACYERAIALKPDYVAAFCNLGLCRHAQCRLEEATARYEQAMAIQPEDAQVHWNLSLTQLLQGRLAEGWRNYEYRRDRKEICLRAFAQPQWHGEPLMGRRILLHSEQGLGDMLQFLRYVPMVQAAGGSVVLDFPTRLRRLVAGIPHLAALVDTGDPLPPFDCHCPMMSLPLAFGTTLENIPAPFPHLTVPEEARQSAAKLRWPASGLKVGLAWTGSPTHVLNHLRSLSLDQLAPLFALEDVHFFSLQMGPAVAELETSQAAIVNLAPATGDMADTAAQMEHLDLVITIDTSVAHLAGTLGKPVWVLLSYVPDWRWLLGREDSPWYPTARLFRQPRQSAWQPVIARVRSELRTLAGEPLLPPQSEPVAEQSAVENLRR